MAYPRTIQRTARLLQRTLATYFTLPSTAPAQHVMTSVAEVVLSPKLDCARIYLSFMTPSEIDLDNKQAWIADYNAGKPLIKKWLGNQLRHKLKRLPELQFYLDERVAQADRIHQLLQANQPH